MSLAILHPAEKSDVEWLSQESCNSFCERRRDQLRRDVEALELVRDELMRTQKETVIQGLCKLNKDVKQLSIKDFNATFGCDVISMIRELMAAAGVVQSSSAAGNKQYRAVVPSENGETRLSMKTPAAHRFVRPPMSMRTARRGEVVKSL